MLPSRPSPAQRCRPRRVFSILLIGAALFFVHGRIYQFRGTGVALSGADGTDANTGQGGARDHRHTKKHTHKHKTHKTHKHTHKKHKNKHAKIHGMLDGYVVAEPNPPAPQTLTITLPDPPPSPDTGAGISTTALFENEAKAIAETSSDDAETSSDDVEAAAKAADEVAEEQAEQGQAAAVQGAAPGASAAAPVPEDGKQKPATTKNKSNRRRRKPTQPTEESLTKRQRKVRDAMKWAWKGYRASGWGKDEAHPVSKTASNEFGLGLTILDALDTLWLMGMKAEFEDAREWVKDNLHPLETDKSINLFETTIRVMGGLLSTYALSGDKMFLEKADEMGRAMSPAFNTSSGIPHSDVNLKTGYASNPGGMSSTSEVTTLQLEWKWLGVAVGKPKYGEMVMKVSEAVDKLSKDRGLVPYHISPQSGQFSQTTITFGARADSYYEYLLKQWLLSGKSDQPKELRMRTAYEEAMQGMREVLLKRSTGRQQLLFIGESNGDGGGWDPKMDHLVCFLPGVLALGAKHGAAPRNHPGGLMKHPDMILAEELARTCYQGAHSMAAGLAPEIWRFKEGGTPGEGNDFIVSRQDSHNLLRPETVESLHVLHHLTRNTTYQDWGWELFQNWEKHSKVDGGGFTNLDSVLEVPPPKRDKMETFFLGETLKYLFLLFEDESEALPLDEWVFNTEAHPLPIYDGWGAAAPAPAPALATAPEE